MSSRVVNTDKLRKLFNRIEPELARPVRAAVKASATRVKVNAIASALEQDIRDTGDMIASIDYKLSYRGMVAVIGPGAQSAYVRKSAFANLGTRADKYKRPETKIRHKTAQMNFMKGYWAEITVPKHIARPPRPFMNAAYEENRLQIEKWFDKAIDKSLSATIRRYK